MRTALLSGGTLRPSSKSVLILHFVWPLLPLIRVNLQFMFDTGSRWLLLSKCIKVPQSIDHPSRHAVSSIGSTSTPGPAEKPETSYYRRATAATSSALRIRSRAYSIVFTTPA